MDPFLHRQTRWIPGAPAVEPTAQRRQHEVADVDGLRGRLEAAGVEFVGTMMNPGTGYGSPWIMNGPYRLYETGGSSGGRPVYYAGFMTIPGHEEEFEGQFFNCVTEIRDDAGYEWYPSNDVAGSIGRGTRQTKRAMDSMALATEDPDAEGEHRWVLIGMSDSARFLTIVYAVRHETIRLISARNATKLETRAYAQRV